MDENDSNDKNETYMPVERVPAGRDLSIAIARVVKLGYVADEYADSRNEPDAVSDKAGDLGDALRQLGARLRRLVDEREAVHRAEVGRLTRERDAAVKRADADGRMCVEMGKRNREMMTQRDDALGQAATAIANAGEAISIIGALSSDETDEEFIALATEDDGAALDGAALDRACSECPGENGEHAMGCSRATTGATVGAVEA
jgi:hypothetical protein